MIDGLSRTLLFLEREQTNYMRHSDEHQLMVKQMAEITKLIIDAAYRGLLK